MALPGYEELVAYYGDLHNHCEISYGHGSLEDAFQNARTQLDFVSVTPHAVWPDMPETDARLASVSAYHQEGFRRAAAGWSRYREETNAANEDGRFVSLLSFEWHSLRSGDHNVYFKGSRGEIIPAATIEEMRSHLRRLARAGVVAFLIPHHIGYRSGYRGINWAEFTSEFSPVVEMFSMHGSAESDDAPYPYLHTMGPRDWRSTMRYGLGRGHVFGVVGSTDHHSAHPGSYGHGRLGIWARELTRAGIWAALAARRTYALTGDNIRLAFSLNGRPMGSILPPVRERLIDVAVVGGGELDVIDVFHNNRLLHRATGSGERAAKPEEPVKVHLELGWGEVDCEVAWRVELAVEGGRLLEVEPRLRGRVVVAPLATEEERHAFSSWARVGERIVTLTTRTWGNPTITSPGTQGICLEILGDPGTRITGRINDQEIAVPLGDLMEGARVGYLGGFLTPAYCFHRAVPRGGFALETSVRHDQPGTTDGADWYDARVRQRNGQWAWSSPIWVGGHVSPQARPG